MRRSAVVPDAADLQERARPILLHSYERYLFVRGIHLTLPPIPLFITGWRDWNGVERQVALGNYLRMKSDKEK